MQVVLDCLFARPGSVPIEWREERRIAGTGLSDAKLTECSCPFCPKITKEIKFRKSSYSGSLC